MYKKIIGGITVIAIAAVAAWNVGVNLNSQKNELSDILLANVEALASEGIEGKSYVRCVGTDVVCIGTGIFRCCI
jgi:hypothetical protein